MHRPDRPGGIKAHRGQTASARKAIRALLADGQPHPWSEISRVAGPLVSPEAALAEYHRGNPGTTRPLFYRVEMGRQKAVLQALNRIEPKPTWTGGHTAADRVYTWSPDPIPIEEVS